MSVVLMRIGVMCRWLWCDLEPFLISVILFMSIVSGLLLNLLLSMWLAVCLTWMRLVIVRLSLRLLLSMCLCPVFCVL